MQILNQGEPAQRCWVPVCTSSGITIYEGSLVTMSTDGVIPYTYGSGAWNTTGKTTWPATAIPWGLVIGTSNRCEQYSSTYNAQYITSVITSNANFTREMVGIEGGWGMDQQAYVYVERIFPWTVLRSNIYFTTVGTAPTVATVSSLTTNGSTGMGYTTAATIGFTSIADLTTAYCRSGLNRGIYRVTEAGSTTALTFTSPFPYAVTIGDTFVHANIKSFGTCCLVPDAQGMWVDGATAGTSGTTGVAADIVRLNLEEAGREYVDFRFNLYNFLPLLV